MKNILRFGLLAILSIGFATGCSSLDKSVHLSTAEDLLKLEEGGEFVLDNDIDCQGMGFNPLGNPKKEVVFDGQGHEIKNIVFIQKASCAGLFGNIDQGIQFRNLKIDGKIEARKKYEKSGVGLFVGYNHSRMVKFENCWAKGEIISVDDGSNDYFTGGFCGFANRVDFKNCLSEVNIKHEVKNIHAANLDHKKQWDIVGGFAGVGAREAEINTSIFAGSIEVTTDTYNVHGGLAVAPFVANSNHILGKHVVSVPSKFKYPHDASYTMDVSPLTNGGNNSISRDYYIGENAPDDHDKCEYNFTPNDDYATKVNLNRHQILSKEVLTKTYKFIDPVSNEEVKMFLEFDETIWDLDPISLGKDSEIGLIAFNKEGK